MSILTDELFATLDRRARPEDVAAIIAKHRMALTTTERRLINQVTRYSHYWSSMASDFERPSDATKQLETVYRVFGSHSKPYQSTIRATHPEDLEALVNMLGGPLGWAHTSDYKQDRQKSDDPGRTLGRRAYNRRVRALRHLSEKASRMRARATQRGLVLLGRSGFAADITRDRFAQDQDAAQFVSYIVARKNLRRQFTLSGKDNPMDELAEALFSKLSEESDWEMVAFVWPKPDVLVHLTQEQIGALTARWMKVMRQCAEILEPLFPTGVNPARMVVRAGMDSSTWNETVQAYNFARSAWLGCVNQIPGGNHLLCVMLPGKAMRLMAADLVYWHEHSGGEPDLNTVVWAALPRPWDVLAGKATCTASQVRKACEEAGLNPEASGWITPLPKGPAAEIRPTPELVHGIAIADPAWAQELREAGVFSGRGGRNPKPDAPSLREAAFTEGMVAQDLPT